MPLSLPTHHTLSPHTTPHPHHIPSTSHSMLMVKYIAECNRRGLHCPLKAAMLFSVAWNLPIAERNMNRTFNRLTLNRHLCTLFHAILRKCVWLGTCSCEYIFVCAATHGSCFGEGGGGGQGCTYVQCTCTVHVIWPFGCTYICFGCTAYNFCPSLSLAMSQCSENTANKASSASTTTGLSRSVSLVLSILINAQLYPCSVNLLTSWCTQWPSPCLGTGTLHTSTRTDPHTITLPTSTYPLWQSTLQMTPSALSMVSSFNLAIQRAGSHSRTWSMQSSRCKL